MLTKLTDRRARRRWARAESAAQTLDPHALKDLQSEAHRLAKRLNRVLRVAESRLAAPLAPPANRDATTHADWTWQPDLWSAPLHPTGHTDIASGTRLTPQIALFHDCAHREITFRQTRLPNATSNGFATQLDVLNFSGSYLSLAIDVPQEGLDNLTRHHIVALHLTQSFESPLDAYARLNLQHGPNTDRVVAKIEPDARSVEFDLAATRLDETRLSRGWIDLIFEAPAMNRITLGEVALNRHLRAEI